jgi:outer membrane lipoprotein-sorting protein
VLAAVVLSEAPAQASCAEQVAAIVQTYYDTVRDFSADFEQTTRSALFDSAGAALTPPARGHVVFAKPGRMRWDYTAPEPSLVVSDGNTLWIYSPTLQEAQRLPVTEGYMTGAALQFLLGDGKLVESFEVSSKSCPFEAASGEGAVKSNSGASVGAAESGTVELELVPRESTTYQRLGITARLDSGEVVATRVVDLLGNETRISFTRMRTNTQPGLERFRFVPEPGVEVIELPASP